MSVRLVPYVYMIDDDHIVCVQVVNEEKHRYGLCVLGINKDEKPRRYTLRDYPTVDNAQFYVERYARKNGWLVYTVTDDGQD